MLWFDNGANLRLLDPLKLRVAAYYYNRARQWGKEVTLGTKYVAYAPSNDDRRQIGAVIDFEKVGVRSPAGIRPGPWMVDDTIGSTWGYSSDMTVSTAPPILRKLIDTASKGGLYMLNISPMADGTIPEAQQETLLGIGAWLSVNGEAIYGTRPWIRFEEKAGAAGAPSYHFTSKGRNVYAIASSWPEAGASIASLGLRAGVGRVEKVELLGRDGPLKFVQDDDRLRIEMPAQRSGNVAWAFRIALAP
jgi:alpha-L-fucosidase